MERRPWIEVLVLVLLGASLAVAASWNRPDRRVALPAPQTAADPTDEPTEVPPTPIPAVETPTNPGACGRGLPSPRFQWTLHVTTKTEADGLGMWMPRGANAGPFLKAYVKVKYGATWYGATFMPDGRLVPDDAPAWPRSDLIRSAATGIQTSRGGSPMCGRQPAQAVPPCVVEVIYPLVFLDRLAEDGPFLTRTYFWVPSSQLVKDGDRPAQVGGAPFSEVTCDTRDIWPRLASSRPAYGVFNGCGSESAKVDTCYAVGSGEYTPGRDGRAP